MGIQHSYQITFIVTTTAGWQQCFFNKNKTKPVGDFSALAHVFFPHSFLSEQLPTCRHFWNSLSSHSWLLPFCNKSQLLHSPSQHILQVFPVSLSTWLTSPTLTFLLRTSCALKSQHLALSRQNLPITSTRYSLIPQQYHSQCHSRPLSYTQPSSCLPHPGLV